MEDQDIWRNEMSSFLDMSSLRCLWDIEVDLSVRQLDIQDLEARKQIWTGSTQL